MAHLTTKATMFFAINKIALRAARYCGFGLVPGERRPAKV
jgi:hypothetical protein